MLIIDHWQQGCWEEETDQMISLPVVTVEPGYFSGPWEPVNAFSRGTQVYLLWKRPIYKKSTPEQPKPSHDLWE